VIKLVTANGILFIKNSIEPSKKKKPSKYIIQPLTQRLNKAGGEEKIHLVQQFEEFLEGRDDRAFIEIWKQLAETQMEIGEIKESIIKYKTYLRINLKMRKVLASKVEIGELSVELLE
jgi:hypothetical protein